MLIKPITARLICLCFAVCGSDVFYFNQQRLVCESLGTESDRQSGQTITGLLNLETVILTY